MVMDLLMFDFARFTCAGSFAGSAGRAYREHKFIGWEQSVGDLIEIAFGTRGDYVDVAQNCAIAFATSDYEVPDAILCIGLDRLYADRNPPRYAIYRPFACLRSVGRDEPSAPPTPPPPDTAEGVLFWWGNSNYVTHDMREHTRSEIKSSPEP